MTKPRISSIVGIAWMLAALGCAADEHDGSGSETASIGDTDDTGDTDGSGGTDGSTGNGDSDTGQSSVTTTGSSGEACTEAECGPAPGVPSELCPDGIHTAGLGPCERGENGVCGWSFTECPVCCDIASVPDCPEPVSCCADGSWVCDDADACGEQGTGNACQG
jgi:hypothetical protein